MDIGLIQLQVGAPENLDAPDTCEDCGFDALLAFPLWVLGPDGLTRFGTYSACARCYDEQGDE